MKKAIMTSTLLIAILLAGGARLDAQTAKRIEFAKGRSSAVVRGSTGNYGASYVISSRSGQKLILTLSPAQKVGIRVTAEGEDGEVVLLREEHGGTFVVGFEYSGDYTILIGSTTGRPVPFTLAVKTAPLTDI